jgi:hypothetical protein
MREFGSLSAFAEHLESLAVEVPPAQHKALGTALVILEKDMREQIGHEQGQVGEHPAWAPLADSTEDEKARLGYPTDAPLLRDGDLQDSFKHEQSGDEGIVGSTDPVMVYHESGTDRMPPRPVVGPALFKNRKKIESLLGEATFEVVKGSIKP